MNLGSEKSPGSEGGDALGELEPVYGYIYSRVGNREDAEDLTQQVALKAWPLLRDASSRAEVRAYLFATAKLVLATFWAERFRLPGAPLVEDMVVGACANPPEATESAACWLGEMLAALPAHYRQVLELRFLRGYSLRDVAFEMGKSVGAVKLIQLRALRAAAAPRQGMRGNPRSPFEGGRVNPQRWSEPARLAQTPGGSR